MLVPMNPNSYESLDKALRAKAGFVMGDFTFETSQSVTFSHLGEAVGLTDLSGGEHPEDAIAVRAFAEQFLCAEINAIQRATELYEEKIQRGKLQRVKDWLAKLFSGRDPRRAIARYTISNYTELYCGYVQRLLDDHLRRYKSQPQSGSEELKRKLARLYERICSFYQGISYNDINFLQQCFAADKKTVLPILLQTEGVDTCIRVIECFDRLDNHQINQSLRLIANDIITRNAWPDQAFRFLALIEARRLGDYMAIRQFLADAYKAYLKENLSFALANTGSFLIYTAIAAYWIFSAGLSFQSSSAILICTALFSVWVAMVTLYPVVVREIYVVVFKKDVKKEVLRLTGRQNR